VATRRRVDRTATAAVGPEQPNSADCCDAAAYTQIDGARAPPTQFRAPIQYVDVDWQDVMYAVYTAGNCALAGATLSTQFLGPTLMQDVLNQAKFGLEVIAHAHNAQRPQLTCR
jgi:hypothetical protein